MVSRSDPMVTSRVLDRLRDPDSLREMAACRVELKDLVLSAKSGRSEFVEVLLIELILITR